MVPYFKIMYLVRRNSYSLASASERCHESEGELYVALTAMCAPFPLGGAARGAPRTDVVRRTSAHTCAPPKGVAWGGAEGGCARGHGSSPSWAGGGAVWGGVPPLGAATQTPPRDLLHARWPV